MRSKDATERVSVKEASCRSSPNFPLTGRAFKPTGRVAPRQVDVDFEFPPLTGTNLDFPSGAGHNMDIWVGKLKIGSGQKLPITLP